MQKQQHPENNPTPKVSPGGSSSQLNQGDVPKDMPNEGGANSSKSSSSKSKKHTKKSVTDTAK